MRAWGCCEVRALFTYTMYAIKPSTPPITASLVSLSSFLEACSKCRCMARLKLVPRLKNLCCCSEPRMLLARGFSAEVGLLVIAEACGVFAWPSLEATLLMATLFLMESPRLGVDNSALSLAAVDPTTVGDLKPGARGVEAFAAGRSSALGRFCAGSLRSEKSAARFLGAIASVGLLGSGRLDELMGRFLAAVVSGALLLRFVARGAPPESESSESNLEGASCFLAVVAAGFLDPGFLASGTSSSEPESFPCAAFDFSAATRLLSNSLNSGVSFGCKRNIRSISILSLRLYLIFTIRLNFSFSSVANTLGVVDAD